MHQMREKQSSQKCSRGVLSVSHYSPVGARACVHNLSRERFPKAAIISTPDAVLFVLPISSPVADAGEPKPTEICAAL
jgi:hypothetical protein